MLVQLGTTDEIKTTLQGAPIKTIPLEKISPEL